MIAQLKVLISRSLFFCLERTHRTSYNGEGKHESEREANFEFPPWDYVPYKDQTENYFRIVRKLSGKGFNPKANFPLNIVSDVDIAKIFGLSTKGFKTTNLTFHPELKKDLFQLYWQLYGTNQVTNNEFMIWFVKSYITQEKGEKVNWDRAATLIVQKKSLYRGSETNEKQICKFVLERWRGGIWQI